MSQLIKIKNKIIQKYLDEQAGASLLKGKSIYRNKEFKLINIDSEIQKAIYKVDSEYYYNQKYNVTITAYDDLDHIKATCSCPYNWGGLCKHQVAALIDLDSQLGYEVPAFVLHNAAHTEIKMNDIDEKILKAQSSEEAYKKAILFASKTPLVVDTTQEQEAYSVIEYDKNTYNVTIKKVNPELYNTSCNCAEIQHKLCLHKLILFLWLKKNRGSKAFEMMLDWDTYKNNLLSEYGYSLNDEDVHEKFEFVMEINDKNPRLIVKDKAVIKLSDMVQWSKVLGGNGATSPNDIINKKITLPASITNKIANKEPKYTVGYLFTIIPDKDLYFPNVMIAEIIGKLNTEGTKIASNIQLLKDIHNQNEHRLLLTPEVVNISLVLNKISFSNILSEAAQADISIKRVHSYYNYNPLDLLNTNSLENPEDLFKLYEIVLPTLKKIFELLQHKHTFVQTPNSFSRISINTIKPIKLSALPIKIHLEVAYTQNNLFVEVIPYLIIDSQEKIPLTNIQFIANYIFEKNNTWHLIDNPNDLYVIHIFKNTTGIKVKVLDKNNLLKNLIYPLQNKCSIDIKLPDLVTENRENQIPHLQIYLKEDKEHLIFQLIVNYEGNMLELNQNPTHIFEENNTLVILHRNLTAENDFIQLIEQLHPNFVEQTPETNGLYYFLNFKEVMKDLWFFKTNDFLKEKNIEIFGFNQLTKFKYNPNPPTINFQFSSGIDWFDAKILIEFGEQTVNLKDVQRAVLRKDRFVALKNGTIGVLPEEWIKKYATLFKMADVQANTNTLRIPKIHFSVLNDLYEQINDTDVLQELREKKQKLLDFHKIKNINLPQNITGNLRDYQKEGFNWLNFLNEFGWGGCLADDMGLGKTFQVLTFLQHQKELQPHKTDLNNLVIVPTSLLFNWEAEIQKFCPQLTFYKHHGTNRTKITSELIQQYDVLLTTYGTLASDIEYFSEVYFHYAILDESQAIKNPNTNRYKAARLIKAHNRIAMTGTPIENNTFDLYAQMNFLNPGLLGNVEFFKEQFAYPIDKNGSQEKVDELRKIIYPFILRRTKEVVEAELPEKTETILFCEMQAQQRKIYDAFKNEYRDRILNQISEQGIEKSSFTILEGLLKLRQICDSPALLNDTQDYGKESIKLAELTDHITQKTGNHKVLIFSQFLEMLKMVKQQLEIHHIPYEYLDGSISPENRQKSVENFQTNPQCRVFLMSLKAGGVGLNLTAADYVYLIDPWWNPAVESQAIDRTHRIGQKNHVFAYKMICKDTIEEKILQMQAKKKSLATDLISTDNSFIKKLTITDIEYLFS